MPDILGTEPRSAGNRSASVAHESPFMNLPLEIRLQIYGWVHILHPIQHAQLAPWYPTPKHTEYFLRPVRPAARGEDETSAGCDHRDRDELLCPHRPLSGLPSALLCASRQVYAECRAIPFLVNEFVFVNWFSSGLWAARAFMRGLVAWQYRELRRARLEILGRDFTGPALKEWIELCRYWAEGLQGLRLKVLVGGGIFEPTASFAALRGSAEAKAVDLKNRDHEDGKGPQWVEGLRRLKGLRRLEFELAVVDWSDEEKLEWCEMLEAMINAGRKEEGMPRVAVTCVEKAVDGEKSARTAAGDDDKANAGFLASG
ncbi:hypothetical protein CCHL11_06971 [Colletotrichum chlorophyti]|uniref:Uncharacterized protein n=1 Tax=Colletotrichum chlorophyti TaxID=708187 RepID=A0A1Q8RBH5_9PEZI|nr:hypothetical protein CCHL11_06971 [Colletotrichum chlorophyti]